jgi:hypothetical protein
MRISFDLDDTLICSRQTTPCESVRSPLLKWWLNEPLRKGTRDLVAELRQSGCEVWICTSSMRSPLLVRLWLALHGVRVGRIITEDTYAAHRRRFPDSEPPSKNPRVFGIDLHIDDSEGVRREGELHGFDVLVVAPDDADWTTQVASEVKRRLHWA